jgi:hypothetical protein
MLARLQSLMVLRLCAALLLATIGAQAFRPVAAPLEQTHGSAFSATTYEVALLVQRSERSSRQEAVPQPLPPVSRPTEPVALNVATLPAWPAPRPSSTGPPPLGDIHSWKPAPRAPPRA